MLPLSIEGHSPGRLAMGHLLTLAKTSGDLESLSHLKLGYRSLSQGVPHMPSTPCSVLALDRPFSAQVKIQFL